MNTAVNMGWCCRSSVYVFTSGGVNTAECELQLFFQGVDVNEVTALYHSTFNVTGRAMRSGEVRPIASVCEREIVGGLQFVRKLHFPLSPSSSFPPDYPLYLTNLVIHPLSAVLSPDLSWPDTGQIALPSLLYLPVCYLLLGYPGVLTWRCAAQSVSCLMMSESPSHLPCWYATGLSNPAVMSHDLAWPDPTPGGLACQSHLASLPPIATWTPIDNPM